MKKSAKRTQMIKPPALVVGIVRHLLSTRLMTIALATATLVSAFYLVVLTHEQRQLYAELEQLNKQRDDLDVEWRKLRLEIRVEAEPSRLAEKATHDLGMKSLELKSEKIVKQVKDSD